MANQQDPSPPGTVTSQTTSHPTLSHSLCIRHTGSSTSQIPSSLEFPHSFRFWIKCHHFQQGIPWPSNLFKTSTPPPTNTSDTCFSAVFSLEYLSLSNITYIHYFIVCLSALLKYKPSEDGDCCLFGYLQILQYLIEQYLVYNRYLTTLSNPWVKVIFISKNNKRS